MNLVDCINIEIKLGLATIPLLLMQVSLRLKSRLISRLSRKTNNIKEAFEEVIQLLGSISMRLLRKTTIKT